MSVHLQELPQFVVCGGSHVGVCGEMARLGVGVRRLRLWRRQFNSLTYHEVLWP